MAGGGNVAGRFAFHLVIMRRVMLVWRRSASSRQACSSRRPAGKPLMNGSTDFTVPSLFSLTRAISPPNLLVLFQKPWRALSANIN